MEREGGEEKRKDRERPRGGQREGEKEQKKADEGERGLEGEKE